MSKESESIARIMQGLNCSEKEAREIYADDCAIEHGEKVSFDLPPEKLEIARKFAHTGTRERKAPTTYNFPTKKRKENATKANIISELARFLSENASFEVSCLEITNKERQVKFCVGDETFELTLVQKRKPKS